MRVLSIAVLGAVTAGAALVACYDPQVTDCQFVCGAGSNCPDGTTCTSGFCRVPGATGTCSPASCPPAPCGAGAVPVNGGCVALCDQQVTFSTALAMCGSDDNGSGWHIAILDTPAKRNEAASHFPSRQAWVGLTRATVVSWQWLDAAQTVVPETSSDWETPPTAEDTAATLDTGAQKLIGLQASEQKPYLCVYRSP